MTICPGAGYCFKPNICETKSCLRLPDPAPIHRLNEPEPALHFVGFRGDEYISACRVFGKPDFYHYVWDQRAQREITDNDIVVFAKYDPNDPPSPFNYDDSNEPGDPARAERLNNAQV